MSFKLSILSHHSAPLSRYKEHEVKQDEPECEMVIEKKCKEVTSKSCP